MFLNKDRMVPFWESELLCDAGFIHGFTTRAGGVSYPPYDKLNLCHDTSDFTAAVNNNRRAWWAA